MFLLGVFGKACDITGSFAVCSTQTNKSTNCSIEITFPTPSPGSSSRATWSLWAWRPCGRRHRGRTSASSPSLPPPPSPTSEKNIFIPTQNIFFLDCMWALSNGDVWWQWHQQLISISLSHPTQTKSQMCNSHNNLLLPMFANILQGDNLTLTRGMKKLAWVWFYNYYRSLWYFIIWSFIMSLMILHDLIESKVRMKKHESSTHLFRYLWSYYVKTKIGNMLSPSSVHEYLGKVKVILVYKWFYPFLNYFV